MRVTVVGGGIGGLATAWALTRRGHAVTLLEQGPIPNPLAASGDHHRIIRRAYGGKDGYSRTITEAFEAWDALWGDLGARHYAPVGVLAVSQFEGDEAEVMRFGLDRGGYGYTLHDADEAARLWPFLDPATFRYAYHTQEGGALHCKRIATGLAIWLAHHGAAVHTHLAVTSVDPASASVVTENGDVIEADRVVIAAGAWVRRLYPAAMADLATYRTAVAYFTPPADLAEAWARAPVILDVGGRSDGYVLPPGGGGGLKFGTGHHMKPTDDADLDRIPRDGEAEAIRQYFSPPFGRIEDYVPAGVVTCAYTFTRDERFFALRDGRALVLSACSGHGYKFGAAVGRRVADALESGDDATLLSWLRAETGNNAVA